MITEIKTIEDVQTFFKDLLAEDLNFHPDDNFADYINHETKQPSYTEKEAADRNRLLTQAFEVCERVGEDIYDVCIEIFMQDF